MLKLQQLQQVCPAPPPPPDQISKVTCETFAGTVHKQHFPFACSQQPTWQFLQQNPLGL
jgi:hypothetical protein